jgi:hypothetical protein
MLAHMMLLFSFFFAPAPKNNVPESIYDFKVEALDGGKIDLSKYKGKKILIVNKSNIKILSNSTDLLLPKNIKDGCNVKISDPARRPRYSENENSSIMIEYIPNNISFMRLLADDEFISNYEYNLFCILFQLYATLATLSKIYTHYDLHQNNIMIINLPKKMLVTYTYNDKNIKLYTKYIPTIIDYGRTYIDCRQFASYVSSENVVNIACTTRCNDLGSLDSKNCSLFIFEIISCGLYSHLILISINFLFGFNNSNFFFED